MRPPEVLDTPRLRVRKLVEADAEAVFSGWAQDSTVTRFLIWRPHRDLEDSEDHVRSCVTAWQLGRHFTWVLEERATGEVVGSIAAYPDDYSVELGYLVAPASWGKGYMVEAVNAVTDWFLAQESIFRVWAEVDTENVASARVLEKAGFAREGTLRSSIMSPNLSTDPRDAFVYGRVE